MADGLTTIKAGIVGGTGYTGVELLRLLLRHPRVALSAITSRKEAGTPVAGFFPSLRGTTDLEFSSPDSGALLRCDVVFFATPNGVAMSEARSLLEQGVRVIDLSADFRLRDVSEWERWYGVRHAAPDLIAQAIYGLPEMYREQIRAARLVANPGCYPTAVQLGFLPLLEAGIIDHGHLVADAKSGVSGAGRKNELHLLHAETSENFSAYGVAGHRHWPEIRQGLAEAAGAEVGLVFVPHLVPMVRGIFATLHARLTRDTDVQALFERKYATEPFVDVLPAASLPDTRSVRASNMCRLAVHRPRQHTAGSDALVVLAVIDNLVKGAAGQAVQNMNLMFGLPETAGLDLLPVVP